MVYRSSNRFALHQLRGFHPAWRNLSGLGLQVDSSTGKDARRSVNRALAGLQEKAFGLEKFLGHCVGLIPASGGFASPAFPVPP
jgi:hypothetical protein